MQQLRARLAEAEASVSERQVEGSSGGGAVRIKASGEFSFHSVSIDAAVLDSGDVTVLEDLILAALRDVTAELIAARRGAMETAVGAALGGIFPEGLIEALGDMDESDPEDTDAGGASPGAL